MTVAVIAAHPDDETLGCGATIAKLAGTREVHLLIMGDGITARQQAKDDRRGLRALYEDAREAAAVLGVASVTFAELPCLRFDTIPLLDVVWRVEDALGEIRPTTVFTHHVGDLNRDHRITAQAVLAATRPVESCGVRDVYTFETPSATEWAFTAGPAFTPNVFVDVTESLDKKIQAMECYRSERRDAPHPRSAVSLRALAQYRGSTAGFECAEAFHLVRSMRSIPADV